MTAPPTESTGLAQAPAAPRRILGRVRGDAGGPLVLIQGGIHGNEPAGVQAAERVLRRLQADGPRLRGEVVALAGNLGALGRNTRFLDRDLNRQWTPEKVALADARGGEALTGEEREQQELLETLREILREAAGREVVFLDLHTFSAQGPPFVTIGDALRNRKLAWDFPVPVVLGLEEQVDGALLEYMNNLGHVTMGIEGGSHADPRSVDNHESLLWIALVAAGALSADDVPDLARRRRELRGLAPQVGRFVEVLERREVRPGSAFRMVPGFRNLQAVRRGELLARCDEEEVRAPRDGLLLLPLYQAQGDDGYFLCREVRTFWLRLSAALRRMQLGGWMRLLPGVRRHPELAGTLIVDTRIAHWYPVEVFHLLGFRKRRLSGSTLVVSRRAE